MPIRILGPHVHRNLAVFTLHERGGERGGFLSLDEALASGLVKVTERAQQDVRRLQIENRSRSRIFLQEGDRLQGGLQDRTVQTTVVVPASSKARALDTFCIEQSRWSGGRAFTATATGALAPRSVRAAAKVAGDQCRVWEQVAKAKEDATRRLKARSTTSSLNELLEDPQVLKASGYFVDELASILRGTRDVVGFAFAVNGRVEEADIYATPALARKLYRKLLATYALEAVLRAGEDEAPLAVPDVERFLATRGGRGRTRAIDDRNELTIVELADRVACTTAYRKRVVHRQVLLKA
ncbi:MAG: DUF6569 family protein [Planctomycetota bacterium]